MKKKIIMMLASFPVAIGMAALISAPTYACTAGTKILTLPCWYDGLKMKGSTPVIEKPKDIWTIVINFIEMALQVVGYLAVGFIIWGGFQFMISDGNSDKAAAARRTIINASVGLILALASVAVIRFIWALTIS
ncbi:hypothetical protein KC939_00800 [Candidatus Saccharibacteria bacterium]|nr:hypothetical protein [Candidatus Saccharibacteria bacterium]